MAYGLTMLAGIQQDKAAAMTSCNRIAELTGLFSDSAGIAKVYEFALVDYHKRFGE
jgi:hypothetical protein